MPRKGFIAKREILPDPLYNNIVVTKLINNIMLDGKKGVAQSIVYGAFEIIAEKTGKDALEVFTQAMEKPHRRKHRSTTLIPQRPGNVLPPPVTQRREAMAFCARQTAQD